jgi:hypothetical protein
MIIIERGRDHLMIEGKLEIDHPGGPAMVNILPGGPVNTDLPGDLHHPKGSQDQLM